MSDKNKIQSESNLPINGNALFSKLNAEQRRLMAYAKYIYLACKCGSTSQEELAGS